MKVIEYTQLEWVMVGLLSGTGPIECLLSNGEVVTVNPGLGPGYWNRARDMLREHGVDDFSDFPKSFSELV